MGYLNLSDCFRMNMLRIYDYYNSLNYFETIGL